MSCNRLRPLMYKFILFFSILFTEQHFANAFDPFTIAAVVSTTANAVGSISEASGEVAASSDAFTELYGEIDSDAQIAEDGQKIVNEIHEIESLAYEAGYTKDEVAELSAASRNKKDGQKLSTTLKSITRAVRTGKRVARLVMKLEKKAQLAQVEQAAVSREQLIGIYKQIRIEHERDLNLVKENLRELKDKHDQIKLLKKEEKNLGAKTFGRTGVLTFPQQDSLIEEAIKIAIQMRPALLQILLFVFLVRVVFYQFGNFDSSRYGNLLRDAILCAVLLMIFPELVRASVSICNGLAARVGLRELHDVEPGRLDFPSEIGLSIKSRILFEWALQWIKYLVFVTTKFLANFGLAFLILMFPLVIFCSQMLGFAIAWPIFLGGFLSICLWPLFWNATGSLALLLWRKESGTVSDQIATILFSLLQFVSPLIGVACLKGQPLSKSVSSASRAFSGLVGSGSSTVSGFMNGAIGREGGGTTGRVLSYPINQTAGRLVAGGMRGVGAMKSVQNLSANDSQGSSNKSNIAGTILKASAAGIVTNHARAPYKTGFLQNAKQVAQGLNQRPILHGALNSGSSSKSTRRGASHVRTT